MWSYKLGGTAEVVHEDFPDLSLADIHSTIAYYLRHQDEIESYLEEEAASAEGVRREIEATYPPEFRQKLRELKGGLERS